MRKRLNPILASILLPALVLAFGCGDANVKKAKKFQSEKNYQQAIHYYRLALDKDPENNAARYGLIESYALEVVGQRPEEVTPERVESAMEQVHPIAQPLMSDPNIKRYISMIYQMIAKRYAEEGRDDKAAEAWGKVVEIEPAFAEAHFNLGLALMKVQRLEDSLPHFEKSISLNPYFGKGYHAMGDALLSLGRHEEAMQQYLKSLELNPDDPAVHHNLGVTFFKAGNIEEAIAHYEQALEIDPGYTFAYRSLHEVYEKTGDTQKLKEIDQRWKERTEAYLQVLRESQKPADPDEPVEAGKDDAGL